MELARIADMLLGFGWGAMVFWALPTIIKERRKNKRRRERWWTKTDIKGESRWH